MLDLGTFLFKNGVKAPNMRIMIQGWDGGKILGKKIRKSSFLEAGKNHYRPERHSLRAQRGSGGFWQPRRVWLGSHHSKILDWRFLVEDIVIPGLISHN